MHDDQPLRLVVFDCDGTLADSQHVIAQVMRAAFQAFGEAPPETAVVRPLVGLPLEVAIQRLLSEAGRPHVDAVAARYRALFRARLDQPDGLPPLYDGMAQAVRALDGDGVLLGICTGRARHSLTRMLEGHGLDACFATLQTGDRHPGKPHPAMLESALAECGIDPPRALMVGDTSFDMEMALNAGVAAMGVAWGYHEAAALSAAGARSVAADAAALVAGIREWLAADLA